MSFDRKMTLTPFRPRMTRRIDVQCLPAAHPGRAGRAREFGQHRHPLLRRLRSMREHIEGQALQRIAGKDRGGFVEGDVHGGLAAAQGVVVHRRQVVVDERITVDQFDRDRSIVQCRFVGAEGRAGGIHQQGAHARAAIEHAVAHRRVQAPWRCLGIGQGAVERALGARAPGREHRVRHLRWRRTGGHRRGWPGR